MACASMPMLVHYVQVAASLRSKWLNLQRLPEGVKVILGGDAETCAIGLAFAGGFLCLAQYMMLELAEAAGGGHPVGHLSAQRLAAQAQHHCMVDQIGQAC